MALIFFTNKLMLCRMVLDSIRTVVIWAVSLGVRWEAFQWLQVMTIEDFFSSLLCRGQGSDHVTQSGIVAAYCVY